MKTTKSQRKVDIMVKSRLAKLNKPFYVLILVISVLLSVNLVTLVFAFLPEIRNIVVWNNGVETIRGSAIEIHELYNVTVEAYCHTESASVSVSIAMDGTLTGFNTPYTFTNLTGTHTFTVPSNDTNGHPFRQWNTGEINATITVTSGETYTSYYGLQPPDWMNYFWLQFGYFGVFLVSIIGTASIIIPVPYTLLIFWLGFWG